MDNLSFGSDSNHVEGVKDIATSAKITRKRTFERINSAASSEIEFFETMDYETKKPKGQNDYLINETITKVLVDLSDKEDHKTDNDKVEEAQTSNSPRPYIWLNKLKYYPIDSYLENMVSFRELLFEDLLKTGSEFSVFS